MGRLLAPEADPAISLIMKLQSAEKLQSSEKEQPYLVIWLLLLLLC